VMMLRKQLVTVVAVRVTTVAALAITILGALVTTDAVSATKNKSEGSSPSLFAYKKPHMFALN